MGLVASSGTENDQLQVVQKSSGHTYPHSKCHNFAIRHTFSTQFAWWAPPWKYLSTEWYVYQSKNASTFYEKWKQVLGKYLEFQEKLKGLIRDGPGMLICWLTFGSAIGDAEFSKTVVPPDDPFRSPSEMGGADSSCNWKDLERQGKRKSKVGNYLPPNILLS